jgi:Alpha/beta hydrolase family
MFRWIGERVSPNGPPANESSVFFSICQRNESSDQVGVRVRWFGSFRVSFVALTLFVAFMPGLSQAENGSTVPAGTTTTPSNIVIGFVGGFVRHDNPHHGPVRLAEQIRRTVPKDTYVRVFENRRRKRAYDAIVRLLDANHDGVLSGEEKSRARIILFGHSWGASAAVMLARDLRRNGVPVLLTVQVDSVAKVWQNDSVIPDNVAEAVNFYQPHGIIHGRARITASDPAKTEILGNYRTDYQKDPIECPGAFWMDRVFTPGHMQSECDPHVWSQIESLVRQRLSLPGTAASASPDTSPAISAKVGPQR